MFIHWPTIATWFLNNRNFKYFLNNTYVTSRSLNTSWSIFIEQLVNTFVKWYRKSGIIKIPSLIDPFFFMRNITNPGAIKDQILIRLNFMIHSGLFGVVQQYKFIPLFFCCKLALGDYWFPTSCLREIEWIMNILYTKSFLVLIQKDI